MGFLELVQQIAVKLLGERENRWRDTICHQEILQNGIEPLHEFPLARQQIDMPELGQHEIMRFGVHTLFIGFQTIFEILGQIVNCGFISTTIAQDIPKPLSELLIAIKSKDASILRKAESWLPLKTLAVRFHSNLS